MPFTLFLLFPNYLPFGTGVALHLNKLEPPSPRDTLCQGWLNLAQWFWRRRWKCESLQADGQTDGQTDDGRQVIRKAHLSFQLRWAKKERISEASICEWILISNYTSGDKWFWDFAQYIIYMKQPLYLAIIPLTPDINV